jgi:outer membrane protein OmpA-like peptidoglycan-associated protein
MMAAWRFFDRLRRRRLGRTVHPDPANARKLLLGSNVFPAFEGMEHAKALTDLRRRLEVPGTKIDAPASVRCTLASAGFPMLRRHVRLFSPEYVFALDVRSPRDHLAYIGRLVSDRLRGVGIHQRRAEHFGNLGALRLDEASGKGVRRVAAAELRNEHSPVRLLAFSEAHDLPIDPDGDGTMAQLSSGDVLLDPRPHPTWDWRERMLQRAGVIVLPVAAEPDSRSGGGIDRSSSGLPRLTLDLVSRLENDWSGLTADDAPSALVVAELVANLSHHLGEDAMRWLRALAIFPLVEPSLTMLIGSRLETLDGVPVLSDSNSIAIARLPWLRAGKMPDWLRYALARGSNRQDIAAATSAIQTFLLPKVGASGTVELSFQDDPAERRALVEWLRHDHESGYADALILDAMQGRRVDKLGVRASGSFIRAVRRAIHNRFGLSMVAMATAVMAASLAILPRTASQSTSSTPPVEASSGGSPTPSDASGNSADTSEPFLPGTDSGDNVIVANSSAAAVGSDATTNAPVSNGFASANSNGGATGSESQQELPPRDVSPSSAVPGPFIIFFDFDKTAITPEASAILDNAAQAYSSGRFQIAIAGHTDTTSTPQYAEGLSQREADAAKRYLMSKGVSDQYIVTEAFGSSRPLVKTAPGVREPQNRRVEITFAPR